MAKTNQKTPDATPTTADPAPVETTQTASPAPVETTQTADPASIETTSTALAPAPVTAPVVARGKVAPTLEQLEADFLTAENRVLDLCDKYPEWADGLAYAMQRYGQSQDDDAFDVSVSLPKTYIRLRHGMSKNVPKELRVNVGEYFTSDRNLGESFEAIVIYAHDARKYFKGTDLTAPECQSHDAKFGSRYGDCSVCPLARYDENLKKSPCSKGFAVILATPDFSVIGELSFMRTAAQAGRGFLQRAQTLKGGTSKWTTEVTTEERTSGTHTNAVPSGGFPKTPTTPEQQEVIEHLTRFFKLRALVYIARAAKRREERGLGMGAGPAPQALNGGDESDIPLI